MNKREARRAAFRIAAGTIHTYYAQYMGARYSRDEKAKIKAVIKEIVGSLDHRAQKLEPQRPEIFGP